MLYNEDCIEKLNTLTTESVHLILSDIPYGIANDDWDILHSNTNSALLGASPAQLKNPLFKKRGKPLNGWSAADKNISKDYYNWCVKWTPEWFRLLKPAASAIIFAGRRNQHQCINAMEDAGFILKDILGWVKGKAAHRAQRVSKVFERRKDLANAEKWNGWKLGNLRPKFEPILWFVKPYKIGSTIVDNLITHGVGAYNEVAFLEYFNTADNVFDVDFDSGEDSTLHANQKPLKLMKALIELTTIEEQLILDPFAGSGTTLLAAKQLNRRYIGFENNEVFYKKAMKRLEI